jgi:hypothetical protein
MKQQQRQTINDERDAVVRSLSNLAVVAVAKIRRVVAEELFRRHLVESKADSEDTTNHAHKRFRLHGL